MTVDQLLPADRNALVAFRPDTAERFYRAVGKLARATRVDASGLTNVPRGPALFVANHAFGGDVTGPTRAPGRH